ncbi:MAG: glycosyltransferase [Alphaproteobacteria bacterium]
MNSALSSDADAALPVIEVLSPFGPDEAVQRMKVLGLIKALAGRYQFKRFDVAGSPCTGVLINGSRINFKIDQALEAALLRRAPQSVMMLLLPDLYNITVARLQEYASVVDVFLVATQELASQVRAFTARDTRVLEDPIDFGFLTSARQLTTSRTPRVIWYGYAESYRKSMATYEPRLVSLHEAGKIEYTIVTNREKFGEAPFKNILSYDHGDFPKILQTFDICVSSHTPLDFSMSTFWKSENKAVLAINRGVPVVASRTPAHERLLAACGLEDFLFDNVFDLEKAIQRLSDPAERARYLDKAQEFVLERYAITMIARKWQGIFEDLRQKKGSASS